MMKRTMWAALAVVVVGTFGARPADAQDYPDYKFDVGVFGGGSWYSAMLDDEHLGEGSDDVRYKAGWVTGLQATFWATPRFGIRAHGAFTERPLNGGDESQENEDGNLLEDINLWSASGDLMIRLIPDGYNMAGYSSMPYIALGIGGKNTNPAGDFVVVPETGSEDETTGVYFEPTPGNGFFQMSQWTLMGLAALGTDLRLADNFGLRLEVGDRFWDATIRDAETIGTNPDEDVGKVTHEIYGQIGAHLLLGLAAPPVVAVAPAPPPPPAPAPPPAPVEERITVCVIDPAAENGIRTVNAIYLPERGDTMVVVNGNRQTLRSTLPGNVMLASEADWFVRGEPLALNLAPDLTLEYTTWQSGRVIQASELAYLGTVRGLPVYASANDVSDIRADLRELRRAQMSDDLDDILDEREDIRGEIEDIQYLYVPLRPTGCVFQTVQQVEQVRKK